MGLVSGLVSRAKVVAGQHPSSAKGWWGGSGKTSAGVEMDEVRALNLSTVWACVNGISADTAKLPLHVYGRLEKGRERLDKHPTAVLLLIRANPEMTAFVFRETMTAWCLTWGNAYAEIERNKKGEPIALWPLKPWRMNVCRANGTSGPIVYEYFDEDGRTKKLAAEDVIHLRGLGCDGLVGYNVIRYARESMGGAYAVEEYGRRHFGNSATPPGVLEHPGKVGGADAIKTLREGWDKAYGGLENAGKIAILEQGMKFNKLSFNPDENQFLATRVFGVSEICRWFRYPPHKAGELSRATFSNIEHQSLEYVVDCLMAWLVRWEQELWFKLLSPEEQASRKIYFEHMVDALLRGDLLSRFNAYKTGILSGFMSPDQAREKENWNPIPDGKGDIFLVPTNMTTAEQLTEDPAADPAAPPPPPPGATPTKKPKDEPTVDETVDDAYRQLTPAAIADRARPAIAHALRPVLRQMVERGRKAARQGQLAARVGEIVDQAPVREALAPAVETMLGFYGLARRQDAPGVALGAAVEDVAGVVLGPARTALAGWDGADTTQPWAEDQAERAAEAVAGALARVITNTWTETKP